MKRDQAEEAKADRQSESADAEAKSVTSSEKEKTMFRIPLVALFAIIALFGAGALSVTAQEINPTCTDGLDNDGDGLIDDADPSCVTLSEEPAATPTAEPTAAPTDAPTAAPTPVATATPTDLPDTGGNPNQDGGPDDSVQTGENFTEWVAETGAIGVIVSFLVMALGIFRLSLTSLHKRIAAVVISVALSAVYISTKENIAIDSLNDVFGIVLSVMVMSQVAYLLATSKLQEAMPGFRRDE